jgi:phenylalanyl-tRNA synthetase beta chain
MNNSLTKGEYYTSLKTFPADNLVKILNPLSTDLNSMRQTLLLNGLEVVAYNINRQQYDIKLFEMGNVYSIKENSEVSDLSAYKEESMISMFISGSGAQNWRGKTGSSHYFVLKGYMELLFKRFGIDIQDLEYAAAPSDMFAEGLVYFAGEKQLAVMGTVNNKLLKQFGIKQPVYAAEISWKVLFDKVKKHKVLYKELPKYPEVRRDLALLLDENVSFAEIRKLAFKTEKKVLKHVSLFDVYRGDKIPQGKKQYAISFILQDTEKTMTDKFVEDVMTRLLNAFSEKFGASLR